MSLKDLESVSLVCREWYKLCKSDKLWKSKCEKVIKSITNLLFSLLNLNLLYFIFVLKILKDVSYYSIQANLDDWRKLFKQRNMLKNNWSTGKYKVIDFTGHTRT